MDRQVEGATADNSSRSEDGLAFILQVAIAAKPCPQLCTKVLKEDHPTETGLNA
jgi:hypothetical protein